MSAFARVSRLGWTFGLGMLSVASLGSELREPASRPGEESLGVQWLRFEQLPLTVDGLHRWPAPLKVRASNFVALIQFAGTNRNPLSWRYDAAAATVGVEGLRHYDGSNAIRFELAEKTTQFADGRIVFSALDAKPEGETVKLETQPGNHRIGFWTNPKDAVSWSYKPTRWGRYDVELSFATEEWERTELAVEIGEQTLSVRRPSTDSWYRYATLPVGRVYIAKAEPFTVRVRCVSLQDKAVMNLKAVILRPAPEGEPIVQAPIGGDVVLRARDAITRSTVMRYEPATNKNCLGYWVNPRDRAEWEFMLNKPGTFAVEVWQGCGRGSGGSDVAVDTAGGSLFFQVEDTGHFQNFVPRRIGHVTFDKRGLQTLAIRPVRKQGAAVMDVREIRLLPVASTVNSTVP